jgi:hypothetical protein
VNINLDTQIDPQSALLQFLIPGPLPFKYIAPVTKQTEQRSPDRRIGLRFEFQDLDRKTDERTGPQLSGPRRTHARTNKAINIVD